MEILKIATAGSVDDGKSTLIGRLLYDTHSITKDKLEAVELSSKRKGLGFTDLSLLTDGLIAEREQGITIDVAHIYFSTRTRKYIIADSPGHVEYTRNMITGASNAQASIVLIDARKGVVEQTRRHLFISSLLQMGSVFICINKMDLVDYAEKGFLTICRQVKEVAGKIDFKGTLNFVPIVAKDGDNIVHRSANMSWHEGKTLLEYLEALHVHEKDELLPARFPVQLVIRPHSDQHHDFRGYAGKLVSGVLRRGQEIVTLPSLKKTNIKKIYRSGHETGAARTGESIVVELEDDLDISRGNMIVASSGAWSQSNNITATVTWMDEEALVNGKSYLLQHGVHIVKAKVTSLRGKVDINTLEMVDNAGEFRLNDIGHVQLKTSKPVFADRYAVNPGNGAFILIDEFSHHTVGVGFITNAGV